MPQKFATLVSYKSEIFSLKWELPTCSHPPSSTPLFPRKDGAKQAALILMKNCHSKRAPLYTRVRQMTKSFHITSKTHCFCPKGYSEP